MTQVRYKTPTPEEIAALQALPREEIVARRNARKERKKREKELRAQKCVQWEIDNTPVNTPDSPPDVVNRFQRKYFFLGNYHPSPVIYDGLKYPSSEHAYQAAKFIDHETKKRIALMDHPSEAKRYAHHTPPTFPAWDEQKVNVMREIVHAKFIQNEDLRNRLLATGDAHLEEGNRHGDTFWGTVDGIGENMLGKILMEIRKQLTSPPPFQQQ